MASKSDKVLYLRWITALVGMISAVAGIVTWITGWEYGHALTTAGLLMMVIRYDFMVDFHAGLSTLHTRSMEKFKEKSDPEGARSYAGKAVHHRRKLAAKRPDQSWFLAVALDQQRDLLTEQGQHEKALAVAREAVEACRRAHALDPRLTAGLATSLNRLALALGRLDREAEAIPITTEAIALTRQVVAQYEGRLALNLSNLVISLLDGDEWERALPPAEEAWEIHRRLAATDRDLRDEAVDDANQLRRILSRLERPEEILRVSEMVVEDERALLADDPARLPELAEAVRRLGVSLVDVGRVPEGKARWYESLELQRRFSASNDDGRAGYAAICERVGISLGMLRHDEETIDILSEGLEVRRALAASDARHHQELVRALASAAMRLTWSEQPELARQCAVEGLALYREHPDSSGPPQVRQVLQDLAEHPFPETLEDS